MKPKEHRNKAVVAARNSGKTLKTVGEEFGITIERVRQICLRNERKFSPAPKPIKRIRTHHITQAERQHLQAVKGEPCQICNAPAPSDAHHVFHDRYSGAKASHWATIALCKHCHQVGPLAIHNNKRGWRERNGPDWSYIPAMLKAIYGNEYSIDH